MKDLIAQVAGMLMTLCFMFCYVPQIIKIYKSKYSKGLSLTLVIMSICGYVCGMIYMFLTEFGIWWFMNYCVGLLMCCVLVYAWFKYRTDG
jgi:uncharacterized protein with PQ loop repeat